MKTQTHILNSVRAVLMDIVQFNVYLDEAPDDSPMPCCVLHIVDDVPQHYFGDDPGGSDKLAKTFVQVDIYGLRQVRGAKGRMHQLAELIMGRLDNQQINAKSYYVQCVQRGLLLRDDSSELLLYRIPQRYMVLEL